MFQAVPCSSSGGQIVLLQPLNRHTLRLFTEIYDTRGCNNTIFSSWRWARYCSKHAEDFNVSVH